MTSVQLTVPMLDKVVNPTTITDPKKLQQWIDNLPFANPLGTSQLLNSALSLINRHPEPLKNRLALMRGFLPPFVNLIKASIKHSKQHTSGKSSKAWNEKQQLTEKITTEMAFGFKHILNETEQFQNCSFSVEDQAEIIHYTIECLTLSLMFYFSHYREEPKNIFREIVQLYLLAERLSNSQIEVKSHLHHADSPTNVRLAFKRILLLQLLDPFHLHVGEIWHDYDYLGCWASHARVAKVPNEMDSTNGRFLIDLQGHTKPQAYTLEKVAQGSGGFLLLDTVPLTAIANKHLQSVTQDPSSDIPGYKANSNVPAAMLFRHMLLAWHIQPHRRHERMEKHDWVIAATGINQACHFLKTEKLVSLKNTNSAGSGSENDEFEITSVIGGISHTNYTTFRLRQINKSASGSALVIHPDEENSLQIGQIIIMQSESPLEQPQRGPVVGIIRRMVQKGKNSLEAGVQYIQGQISAVEIRPVVFGATQVADFQPSLYLDRGSEQPGTLFTPHLLYQKNREFVAQFANGEVQRLIANRLLEASHCYERFEFHTIDLKKE